MNTQDNNTMELPLNTLESVSGGTTDPADLDLILRDYHAKHPGGTVEELLNEIRQWQVYSIEMDGDVRPFRFYYEPDSKEMNEVLRYLQAHF